MIITRTPFRISFFGGGTDYPTWFKEHGGAVLSTTIDKYCYISVRKLPPFFDHKHRVVYSKIENVKEIREIEHPSVRAVLNWLDWEYGLEIHHDGDLPARSGLGSSSAFTVGLIHALSGLRGRHITSSDLASSAIHVEQNLIQEAVGSQDQIAAAIGGLNRIEFRRDGSFEALPVVISENRKRQLLSHLQLFFTGHVRFASEIASSKIRNMSNKKQELSRMREMVDEALEILNSSVIDIKDFGKLLHESWLLKRGLSSKVSNEQIDQLYQSALECGAIGGKILGAGGGGFLLLFVPPERQNDVRKKLRQLVHVPFCFEYGGSRLVVFQPDGWI